MSFIGKIRTLKRIAKECRVMAATYRDKAREVRALPEHTIVIWGVPLHGNIGDHAISCGEVQFLEKQLLGRRIFMIPEDDCLEYLFPMKRYARKKGILFVLHGGGNMGQMYRYQEERREMLLRAVRNRPLILFPQSVDDWPETFFYRAGRKLYQRHPNLHLFAREQMSYEKMKKLFPNCRVSLVPDIVTSLDKRLPERTPELDVLFCVRSDCEANVSSGEAIALLREYLKGRKTDTVDTYGPGYVVPYADQPAQLEEFWSRIKSAKLVVTDRLHGMIFSMITNTPCIAFDNTTGKVAAFYRTWLKDVPGIMLYTGDIGAAEAFADSVLAAEEKPEAYLDLSAEFTPLREALKKYI